MSDLAEFLLARIAEDEAIAKQWPDETGPPPEDGGFWMDMHGHLIYAPRERILAECKAKRSIVTEFGSSCSDYSPPGSPLRTECEAGAAEHGWEFQPHWPEQYAPFCDGCAAAQSADMDHQRVLRYLALPYADHPDWREEWRP